MPQNHNRRKMESASNCPQFRTPHTTVKIQCLPKEIIEEILSKNPVKSLLQFRCVSKSWRSLIGSRRFIKFHIESSTKNPSFAHHKIVFLDNYPPRKTLKHTSLHSLMNEPVTDTFELDDPIYTSANSIRLVGCCDGLICILIDRRLFFLCNPSMRTYKKLPFVDQEFKQAYISKCGFGYDESCDDYKVFAVLSLFQVTGKNETLGKIYSLTNNFWKVLRGKDVHPFVERGKFVNGKLYWGSRIGVKREWGIVSFDLKNEVHGVVEQPNLRAGKKRQSLEVLGGHLCLLCDYRKICADYWIMKENGVKESWEKVLTVPYPCGRVGPFLSPVCIGSKGEVLCIFESSFMIYYPEDNMYRHPKTRHFHMYGEADVYVESLVSLVADDEGGMEIQRSV